MSYCRFSSDDWSSDVYVYEDGSFSGWTTHVAGSRVVFKEPLPPPLDLKPGDEGWPAAYIERHNTVMRMLDDPDRVDIDLPHAKASFSDSTPGACADRLESLRALGYNVPQYAIDALREEQE